MNVRTIVPILFVLFVVHLSGCNGKQEAELTRSVDWYKEHKVELKEKLAECNNNAGELMATPNCINAQKAKSAITWGARGKTKLVPLTADQLKKRK